MKIFNFLNQNLFLYHLYYTGRENSSVIFGCFVNSIFYCYHHYYRYYLQIYRISLIQFSQLPPHQSISVLNQDTLRVHAHVSESPDIIRFRLGVTQIVTAFSCLVNQNSSVYPEATAPRCVRDTLTLVRMNRTHSGKLCFHNNDVTNVTLGTKRNNQISHSPHGLKGTCWSGIQ